LPELNPKPDTIYENQFARRGLRLTPQRTEKQTKDKQKENSYGNKYISQNLAGRLQEDDGAE
jgi:hypothetical protein